MNLPVGRLGVPEDVASYVSWITSQDAGFVTGTYIASSCTGNAKLRHATGQTISINGGALFD